MYQFYAYIVNAVNLFNGFIIDLFLRTEPPRN